MHRSYNEYADRLIQELSLKRKSGDEYGDVPCPNPHCDGGTDRFYINNHNGELRHHCRKDCDFIERDKALQSRNLLPSWELETETPYHEKKRIPLLNARLDGANVVIPLAHVQTGKVVGQQTIKPNGAKIFNKGLKKIGVGCFIGDETERLYVTEGYATGVAVHKATGQQVFFALDANTLPKTVKLIEHPNVVIAADNDDAGIKAAEASGKPWAAPENNGDDWWDVYNQHGNQAVTDGLKRLLSIDQGTVEDEIEILSEDEFIGSLEIPDPIIDNLVARGRHLSLTANTGDAKTAMAAYFMLSISEPECVPLELVQSSCDVLFCSGENPDDLKMRLLGHKADNDKLTGKRRYFISGVFDVEQSFHKIETKAKSIPDLGLIIVDTKQAFQTIENNNDNAENLRFASACRRLTFLPSRPAVLVLCHPIKKASKDNLVPRGGSAYLNEVDGNLSQWRSGEIVTLHWSGKFRGSDFEPIQFKLKKATHPKLVDKLGRQIETVILERLSETAVSEIRNETIKFEDRVLLSVRNNPKQSAADRCFDCGLVNEQNEPQKSKMHRMLNGLKNDKLINKLRKGWELTAKGKKEVEQLDES